MTASATGFPSPPAPHPEGTEALGGRTALCSMHYMMLVPRKVPAPCAPFSIFQEQKSPTIPFRVPGAHLITPRDPCSHSPRTGRLSHLTLQLGKCFGPKSKAQSQPRQRLPRGEEEHDGSSQPQPFQGTRFRKHFPGHTHLVPTATLGASPPFPLVCRRDQMGLREVGRHSHDSELEAAQFPLSPQLGRGSAHLMKRRSSTCWGVPKAL